LLARSWRKTVSPSTIGVLANVPNAPWPVSLNRHFGFRFATFVESMRLAVVARVFARSRLKAGHCWENAAASAGNAPADGEDAARAVASPTAARAATSGTAR
jgi:hypothetical protein